MATATASLNMMRTGRQDNRLRGAGGKTAPEPWFALNRSAYQAILNVVLAEMTSSAIAPLAMGGGGNSFRLGCVTDVSCSVSAGSELLRLLRTDDESIRMTASSAADVDDHVTQSVPAKARVSQNSSNMTSHRVTGDATLQRIEVVATELTSALTMSAATKWGRASDDDKVGNSCSLQVRDQQYSSTAFDETNDSDVTGRDDILPETNLPNPVAAGDKNLRQSPGGDVVCSDERRCDAGISSLERNSPETSLQCRRHVNEDVQMTPSSDDRILTVVDKSKQLLHCEVSSSVSEVVDSSVNFGVSMLIKREEPSEETDHDFDRKSLNHVLAGSSASSPSPVSDSLSPRDISQSSTYVVSRSDNGPAGESNRKPKYCWVPIDKDVVATIVDRQLSHQQCKTGSPVSPVANWMHQPVRSPLEMMRRPNSVSPTVPHTMSTMMTSHADGVQTSPPAAHRSQLLADLLHQTDEILAATVPEMAFMGAPKKRQASPSSSPVDFNAAKESAARKTEHAVTAKRPKWSADNPLEVEQLATSASSKNRVQVRSTWRVPSTNINRRHELVSQLLATSPSPTTTDAGDRRDSFTFAPDRSPPLPTGGHVMNPPVVIESSQVWTAVDKALVLDVIDHLLDLEVGDTIETAESAIDLTIVRPPNGATIASTGTSLTSGRELLALLSYTSTAGRIHSDAKPSFHSQRDRCSWQSMIAGGQADLRDDGEIGYGNGGGDMNETASQLKWKSNIMQRMRREQTTTGKSAAIVRQPGCGIWRRGANSIAATGS